MRSSLQWMGRFGSVIWLNGSIVDQNQRTLPNRGGDVRSECHLVGAAAIALHAERFQRSCLASAKCPFPEPFGPGWMQRQRHSAIEETIVESDGVICATFQEQKLQALRGKQGHFGHQDAVVGA